MSQVNDLVLLIKSSVPLILIETSEETRAINLVQNALSDVLRPLFKWSVNSGMERIDLSLSDFGNKHEEPELALSHIARTTDPSIFLLLDFHPYLSEPKIIRRMREIALRDGIARHTVVMISPKMTLPDELASYTASFDLDLPTDEMLEKMIREEAFEWSRQHDGRRIQVSQKALGILIQNLKGLTLEDARRLACNAIYNDGAITSDDIQLVMEKKFSLLNRGGVLTYEYELIRFSDIAGLKHLKHWIQQRKPVFVGGDEQYGLDAPKGMLLLGVQGCGKSMAAKATASGFGVPLLRLDFGAIYNKYHGETERNLRESLKNAEVMEPCVLWIDEIEKGLSVSDSDSGTSKRILGTLLTWMAEREERVFLVATANDIESLPPELVRKGRFDEIFFVDLPTDEVRQKIFEIHLKKRKQDPENFDLAAISDAAKGFSGSEIEQVVVSALYSTIAEKQPLNQAMLLDAIDSTKPLSVVMSEKIDHLRHWASSRTVPAG